MYPVTIRYFRAVTLNSSKSLFPEPDGRETKTFKLRSVETPQGTERSLNLQHTHWKDFSHNVFKVNYRGNASSSMQMGYLTVIKKIYALIGEPLPDKFAGSWNSENQGYPVESIEEIFPSPCKNCGSDQAGDIIQWISTQTKTCYKHDFLK